MSFRPFLAAMILVTSALSHAQDYRLGELQVSQPYARPTVPGQPAGSAYLNLQNNGKNADKLVSAASPIAGSVQIHTMSMDGNVMRMREVAGVDLPPGARLAMKPGDGYHLMLMGLKQPLKTGDKFPLTLVFEKAGKIEVTVPVDNGAAKEKHHHH